MSCTKTYAWTLRGSLWSILLRQFDCRLQCSIIAHKVISSHYLGSNACLIINDHWTFISVFDPMTRISWIRAKQRIFTCFVMESMTVRLTSCLTGLDSTNQVDLLEIFMWQCNWILTSQTGGQPYLQSYFHLPSKWVLSIIC